MKSSLPQLALLLLLIGTDLVTAADQPTNAPVVQMRSFKVFAEWMEIQPVLRKGVIEWVRVVHVRPRSPAAAAGLVIGMRIVEIQGVSMVGLTEAQFAERLDSLPVADRLTLMVMGLTESTVTPLSISFSGENMASPLSTPTASPTSPTPSQQLEMTEAEARQRLAAAERVMENEMRRIRVEAREKGRATFDGYIMQQVTRELSQIPARHLALLCETAIKAEGPMGILSSTIVNAIIARSDYAPQQKETVLKYLPKLPRLILTLDKMQWFGGTQAVLAAGWKKARESERDGMLDFDGSRYARLAAQQGVHDALIAIARTVRNPNAGQRMGGRLLSDEIGTLKALLPIEAGEGRALGEFAVKNRDRLVFDAVQSIYVLKK